jgi:hypothetical protein
VVTGNGPYVVRLYLGSKTVSDLFAEETYDTIEATLGRVEQFCRYLPKSTELRALRRALEFKSWGGTAASWAR